MFQAGQQIGSYKLVKKLDRGGFGEVWLAEKQSEFVTKKVAVKLPLDEQVNFDEIRQEATLWEQASGHPNVLPLIDADVYDGQVAIVSEYAEGGSLAQKLKSQGTLSIKEAVETIIGILNGLEYLHSKGIVHRDIKPQNILLQGATPRLADFGISRAIQAPAVSSVIVGTENYMSPESFEGVRSEQTDLWSVGVLLYLLLKGSLPFPQSQPTETMYAILLKDPEPLPDEIPPRLREIVFKALEKDKDLTEGEAPRRYQTAAEMREDLIRFLETATLLEVSPNELKPRFPQTMDEVATRVKMRIPLTRSRWNSVGNTLSKKENLPFVIGAVLIVFFALGWLTTKLFDRSGQADADQANIASNSNGDLNANSAAEEIPVSPNEKASARAEQYFNQAAKFYEQKRYDRAIDAYTKAIALTPNDYSLYNNRGLVYYTQRRYTEAINDFNKSIELSPKSVTYNNRGVAQEDQGNTEQAINDYRKALELDASNETAFKNLNKILGK